MANRFTATEKWEDPWFCGLSPAYKLFWFYICENCNHAGIWNVNWPLVKFHCWETDFDVKQFGDRIVVINEEKWFIKKFVLFQQKISVLEQLNPENKCHASILKLLYENKVLSSPLQAPKKGLPRGLGIGNSKGNVVKRVEREIFKIPRLEQVIEYCKERNNNIDAAKWHNFYSAKDWMIGKNKMKDWKAAVRTWENKENNSKPKRTLIAKADCFMCHGTGKMGGGSNCSCLN